jgi:hypothetical protein
MQIHLRTARLSVLQCLVQRTAAKAELIALLVYVVEQVVVAKTAYLSSAVTR